jgi:hypothetical protein
LLLQITAFYPIPKAVTIQAGIKMAQSYRNVQLRTITLNKEGCNYQKHREIWVHRHFHNSSLPALVQRQINPVYAIQYCALIPILILWYPLHMVLPTDFFPLGFHLKFTSIISSELSVSRRITHRVTKFHVGCSTGPEITTVPKKTFRWNNHFLTLHKPKIRTVNVRSLCFTYAPQRHASVFVCGQSKPWGKQNNHIALE